MLNRHGQLDAQADDYERRFGQTEEDFPAGSGRPRRPVRPVGRISLTDTFLDPEASDQKLSDETGPDYSERVDEVGSLGHNVFAVESVGGVAVASMTPSNTRLV